MFIVYITQSKSIFQNFLLFFCIYKKVFPHQYLLLTDKICRIGKSKSLRGTILKLRGTILKLLKLCGTILKLRGTILKLRGTILKLRGTILKLRGTILKLRGTILKLRRRQLVLVLYYNEVIIVPLHRLGPHF